MKPTSARQGASNRDRIRRLRNARRKASRLGIPVPLYNRFGKP